MIDIFIKTFSELTTHELHDLIRLRLEVFVVEQNAAYQDLDDLDKESTHYFIKENGIIVSYLRTLKKGLKFRDDASIGRIVTKMSHRGKGYSRILLQKAIEDVLKTEKNISIEGQTYLKTYYESFGFMVISEIYLLDGLDHYLMRLER